MTVADFIDELGWVSCRNFPEFGAREAPNAPLAICSESRGGSILDVVRTPDGWLQIGTLLYLDADGRDSDYPVPHEGRGVLTYYDMQGSKESWAAPEDDIRLVFDAEHHEWAVFVRADSETADELGFTDRLEEELTADMLRAHQRLRARVDDASAAQAED